MQRKISRLVASALEGLAIAAHGQARRGPRHHEDHRVPAVLGRRGAGGSRRERGLPRRAFCRGVGLNIALKRYADGSPSDTHVLDI